MGRNKTTVNKTKRKQPEKKEAEEDDNYFDKVDENYDLKLRILFGIHLVHCIKWGKFCDSCSVIFFNTRTGMILEMILINICFVVQI